MVEVGIEPWSQELLLDFFFFFFFFFVCVCVCAFGIPNILIAFGICFADLKCLCWHLIKNDSCILTGLFTTAA